MYVCTIIMKNILDNSETTIIQQRMQKLDENSRALWGKMKVNEMLAHLNDSFRITFGMKSYDDKSNFFTNKLVFPVACISLTEMHPLKLFITGADSLNIL